jgi:hypothetical protein
MTWLNPLAWLWGLLALPLILLYILRIRRRKVQVPTVMFWNQVFQESKPRAWWQQLRHLVSLLLQLLFLFLLVMALTDPLTAGQSKERRLWILGIDRSASMAAVLEAEGDGTTRLGAAIEEAIKRVDRIREWDETLVFSFARDVEVRCGRTSAPGTVRSALRTIRQSDMPAEPDAALEFARGISAGDRLREIVFFTDAPGASQWKEDLPEDLSLVVVGDPLGNVGITAFGNRPAEESRDLQRLLLRVRNENPEPQTVTVSLRNDEVLFDSVHFELGAGEERTAILEHPMPEGGVVEARLTGVPPDGVAADDQAFLVIPAPRQMQVVLVSDEPSLFLSHVLAAQPLVNLRETTPLEAAQLDPESVDLFVYNRHVPDELPEANAFYLSPSRDSVLWNRGEALEHVLISPPARDEPLLRHVQMDNVLVHQALALVPGDGHVLLRSLDHPIYAAWFRGKHRVLALAIDLERSDLALRTAFPILMANAIDWIRGEDETMQSSLHTGDIWTAQLGDYPDVHLVDEEGAELPTALHEGRILAGPFERIGVYSLADLASGDIVQQVAVNLNHPRESAVPLPHEPQDTPVRILGLETLPRGRGLWFTLALLALLLSVAEWGMHQRRVIE